MPFVPPPRRPRFTFFSVRTQVLLAVTIVVITGMCVFFFLHSRSVVDRLVKDRLRNEAAIAAMQFTGEELASIRSAQDMQTPEFGEIVWRLKDIRAQTPGIRFLYIMRRTDDPQALAFVADADALESSDQLDRNNNGTVESFEQPGSPGDLYSIKDVPALQNEAFIEPTTDDDVTRDQWGYSISGYAPIRTSDGQAVAVLGIDLMAEDYAEILQSIFSLQAFALVVLGGVFIVFAVLGGMWKHRVEQMRHLDDERRWLLQLILHQVGTPLTIFKWGVESLKEMMASLPHAEQDEVRENVLIMEDGISRLDHVSEVLLAADRIQEGSMQVEEERVSLKIVVEDTIDGIASRVQQRGQRIDVQMPEDCMLTIDRRLLSGILRELLDNAIVYSPQQGVITVRVFKKSKHVEVSVQDHGGGIPHGDLPRMFERFSRGSNAGKFDPNGTGVGLYIARGIIERFGGKIGISSVEGQGTTITFTLPIVSER